MSHLLVGSEECSVKRVVQCLLKNDTGAIILKGWRELCRELDMTAVKIEELRRAELLETKNIKDIIWDVLCEWRMSKGNAATLESLCNHLVNLEWNHLAECLQAAFEISSDDNQPKFKESIPTRLPYYVPRKLSSRNKLTKDVFLFTTDIFVVIGIEKYKLTHLANARPTGTSRNQVHLPELTISFILLEQDGDWQRLCEKATRPIHLIRYNSTTDELTWVASGGNVTSIQTNLEYSQDTFSEETFVAAIDKLNSFTKNQPVIISDSPGMGKSVLLAEIARQLNYADPSRIVIFIAAGEWIADIARTIKSNLITLPMITNFLLEHICENDIARKLLSAHFDASQQLPHSIEIMLDGFDEIDSKLHHIAYKIVDILRGIRNTRVWITTRPHFLLDLENYLNVLGFNILPFCESDQIICLEMYWMDMNSQLNTEKLIRFARLCLLTIKSKLTSKDNDIAGVPLQCMLIAEIFEEEARDYCTSTQVPEQLNLNLDSISDLYTLLVLKKFSKFTATTSWSSAFLSDRRLKNIHVLMAVQLIFPNFNSLSKSFILELEDESSFKLSDYLHAILNVGLLEASCTSPSHPRFIHRTFAEYFIAWFVVDSLYRSSLDEFSEFLLKHVLCTTNLVDWSYIPPYVKEHSVSFEHLNICHFINSLLPKQSPAASFPAAEKLVTYSEFYSLRPKIVKGCLKSNYSNLFGFIVNLGFVSSNCFEEGCVILAVWSCSSELFRFLMDTILTCHDGIFLSNEQKLKILGLSLERANYGIVECLLSQHGFADLVKQNESNYNFLKRCIENSRLSTPAMLEEVVQIVKYLVNVNPKILDITEDNLSYYGLIHGSLLIELVSLNVNCLRRDKQDKCVLDYIASSRYVNDFEFHQLLGSVKSADLKEVVNRKFSNGETILHVILHSRAPLRETMQLLRDHSADFNARNNFGATPLVFAIMTRANDMLYCVQLLLEFGADNGIPHWLHLTMSENIRQNRNADNYKSVLELVRVDLAASTVLIPNPMTSAIFEIGNLTSSTHSVMESECDTKNECQSNANPCNMPTILCNHSARVESDNSQSGAYSEAPLFGMMSHLTQMMSQTLQLHVDMGVDVTSYAHFDKPLLLNAMESFPEVLQSMVRGADFNKKDAQGHTIIHQILMKNHPGSNEFRRLVETLILEKKVDALLILGGEREMTSLQMAIALDILDIETLELLYSEGVRFDTVDKYGWSNLHHAVCRKDPRDFVVKLVENGADTGHVNKVKASALDLAMHCGTYKTLWGILKGQDENFGIDRYISENASSPQEFHCFVEALIVADKIGDFCKTGSTYNLPLIHLALKEVEIDKSTLELLCDQNINLNVTDGYGSSLLLTAIQYGRSIATIKGLVELGVNWKKQNNHNTTIVHSAASFGRLSALEYFLGMEFDDFINQRDNDGDIPLHCVVHDAKGLTEEIVKLLIRYGSNIKLVNNEGKTPYDYAVKKNRDECILDLLKH